MEFGNARFKYEAGIFVLNHVQWGTENIDYTQAVAWNMTPAEFQRFVQLLHSVIEQDSNYYKLMKRPDKKSYYNDYNWLLSSGYSHLGTYDGIDIFAVLNRVGTSKFLVIELLSRTGSKEFKYSNRIDINLGQEE